MDIRSLQKPLKEQYRREPSSSRITLTAKGSETATPLSCSVDIGRAIYQAEAHKGVGGTGTAACSGDLLIGALRESYHFQRIMHPGSGIVKNIRRLFALKAPAPEKCESESPP